MAMQSTVDTPSPALVHNRVEYYEALGSGRKKRKAPWGDDDDASVDAHLPLQLLGVSGEEQENRRSTTFDSPISPGLVSSTKNKLVSRESVENSMQSPAVDAAKITPGSVRKSIERWSKGSPALREEPQSAPSNAEDSSTSAPAAKRQKIKSSGPQAEQWSAQSDQAAFVSEQNPTIKARKSDFLSVAWEDENSNADDAVNDLAKDEPPSSASRREEAKTEETKEEGSSKTEDAKQEDSTPARAVAQWIPSRVMTSAQKETPAITNTATNPADLTD
eukprot:3444839-Rhodomonas_salina.1